MFTPTPREKTHLKSKFSDLERESEGVENSWPVSSPPNCTDSINNAEFESRPWEWVQKWTTESGVLNKYGMVFTCGEKNARSRGRNSIKIYIGLPFRASFVFWWVGREEIISIEVLQVRIGNLNLNSVATYQLFRERQHLCKNSHTNHPGIILYFLETKCAENFCLLHGTNVVHKRSVFIEISYYINEFITRDRVAGS